ncbi:MAG TPA: hypothetical protein VM389_13065 [Phycisphaerae bacterium]|nr:hypothetical protein [Phycisphaerae bacterium]
MHAVALACLCIFGALSVPPAGELAAAEAEIREVFGRDLSAARKPADKAAVARRMIDLAAESRQAAKYALLTRARDLAVAARDSAAGIRAVEGLAGFAGPSDAAEGHRLWSGSRDLGGKLTAAEVYLRALPRLTGFERGVVEGRLRELGWRVGPIDFNFDDSAEGWKAENHIAGLKAEGGRLMGKITGGDPFLVRTGLAIDGDRCPVLYIRLSLDSAAPGQFLWTTRASPRWDGAMVLQWPILNDREHHVYRLDLGKHPLWAGQVITSLRIDPGERDHEKPHLGQFSIDYIRSAERWPTLQKRLKPLQLSP